MSKPDAAILTDPPAAAATGSPAPGGAPGVTDRSAIPPAVRSLLINLPVPVAVIAVALLGHHVVTRQAIGAYGYEMVMQVGVAVVMAVSLQLINGFSGQFSLGHAGFMAVGAYLSGYPAVAYSRELADPGATLLFYVALLAVAGVGGAAAGGAFWLAQQSRRVHRSLPAVALVVLFAWVIFDIAAAANAASPPGWAVFSRGVGLLRDLFAGIVSAGGPLGRAVTGALPAGLVQPASFVVLLVGGGLCAAVAGLIVGLPTLRLRGDYLAIATLGFGEIIRIAIVNSPPLGGALGLGGIPTYADFGWLYAVAVVTIVCVWRLAYSGRGRAIQAVREDEIAAAAVGVDPTRQKVLAFVVGAFFGGVGGALYAHYTGFIDPPSFGFQRSIDFVVMVTLGGLASISGAVLAAVVLTLLPELLRNVDDAVPGFARATGVRIADLRMVLYALLLIAMMLLRPQGLLGGRELWPRAWGKRRRARARQETSPVVDADTPKAEASDTLDGAARNPDRGDRGDGPGVGGRTA